jgi:hypothetical protein
VSARTDSQLAAQLNELASRCETVAIRLEGMQGQVHHRREIRGSAAQVIAVLLGYSGTEDNWRVCIRPAIQKPARKKKAHSKRVAARVGTTEERDGGTVVILDPSCVGGTP